MHTFRKAWEMGKFRYIVGGLCENVSSEGNGDDVELFFKALQALRKESTSGNNGKLFRVLSLRLLFPLIFRRHGQLFHLCLENLCHEPWQDIYLHLAMHAAHALRFHLSVCAIANTIGLAKLSSRGRKNLCEALSQLQRHPLAQEIAQRMLREGEDGDEDRQILWKSAMGDEKKMENFH